MKQVSMNYDEQDPQDMLLYEAFENCGRRKRTKLHKAFERQMLKLYGNFLDPKHIDLLIMLIEEGHVIFGLDNFGTKALNQIPITSTLRPTVIKPKKSKTKKSEQSSKSKKSVETKSVIRIESDENPIPDTKVLTSQLEVATTINSEPAQTNSSSLTEKPKKFDYGFMNAYIGDDDVFD